MRRSSTAFCTSLSLGRRSKRLGKRWKKRLIETNRKLTYKSEPADNGSIQMRKRMQKKRTNKSFSSSSCPRQRLRRHPSGELSAPAAARGDPQRKKRSFLIRPVKKCLREVPAGDCLRVRQHSSALPIQQKSCRPSPFCLCCHAAALKVDLCICRRTRDRGHVDSP